jgi:RNA polymerase sigma-70 factor (ECF subfamily)
VTGVPRDHATTGDAEFEALRPQLRRLAYSQLGSLAEAEDVVQEAWLRLQRTDRAAIANLRAWLTTVVGRLALDELRSARVRRERYVGTWLPEPVVEPASPEPDPADRVTLDESVSHALLVVLESLSPAERTAFVLHDVFGYAFDEVAEVVGRTPASARQLASRARRHISEQRPRYPATHEEQRRVIEAFFAAAREGDMDGLVALLDPDVVMRSDGGGRVAASRKPLVGVDRVSRAVAALTRTGLARAEELRMVDVNGVPGLLAIETSGTKTVASFTVDAGRIVAIDIVRNPEKLRHVR